MFKKAKTSDPKAFHEKTCKKAG